MSLAAAFDDVKINQFRREPASSEGRRAGALRIPFFGSGDNPSLPLASLNQHDPGRYSGTHFHRVDQFQVIVDGKGKLGRHDLAPYSVHFTRAYTPYGPVLSDAGAGLTFFVLRAQSDASSLHLPEQQDQLNRVPNRQPWQITRRVTFPVLPSGTGAADAMLQAVPDMEDEEGLAAFALSMKPDTEARMPDPSRGDGQYLVVVKGSLLHDEKEQKALALVFVYPEEGPFQVHAGSAGLEALVLNFPRRQARLQRV